MVNLLRLGSDCLEKVFEERASVAMEYVKIEDGAKASIIFTPGQSGQEASQHAGLHLPVMEMDALIRLHTPLTGSDPASTAATFQAWLDRRPQLNDQILYDGNTYIVTEKPGQKHWRWTDSFHTQYRIYTKLQLDGIDPPK